MHVLAAAAAESVPPVTKRRGRLLWWGIVNVQPTVGKGLNDSRELRNGCQSNGIKRCLGWESVRWVGGWMNESNEWE